MASEPQPLPVPEPGTPTLVLELSLKGQLLDSRRFVRDVVVVGRHPHCDLWIDNTGVSRQHLRLTRLAGGEFQVEDLGSANGTFLNDKPVRTATVRHGDILQFSKYTLRIGIEGAPVAMPRPQTRNRSEGDGATVMLSPTELRELLHEVRGDAAPAARSATSIPKSAAPARASAGAVPARRPAAVVWALAAFIVLVAGLAAVLVAIGR